MDQITKLMKEITSDIENILEYKDIGIIKEFSISDKGVRLSNAKGEIIHQFQDIIEGDINFFNTNYDLCFVL